MDIVLKGGHRTSDPRLDRVPQFDEQSRAYPIAAVVPEDIKTKTWPCATYLDQGQEGACVLFAWDHEAAASPVPIRGLTEQDCFSRYHRAQRIDEWPGENYSGTSVLAGAKIMQQDGFIGEYRWGFGIDDALRALSHEGPGVFGIPWLDSMFDTRPSGLLDCSGNEAGGHGILATGVVLHPRLKGESKLGPIVRLHNSWNRDWGHNGDAFIRVEDLERLLLNGGEFCIPVDRLKPKQIHAPVA